MRRAAKIDANQPAIVDALRRIGAQVTPLHAVGNGCPDLLVSHRGRWHLIEVKDGAKPPSARLLTDDQAEWHAAARAPVHVVKDVGEAMYVIADGEVV